MLVAKQRGGNKTQIEGGMWTRIARIGPNRGPRVAFGPGEAKVASRPELEVEPWKHAEHAKAERDDLSRTSLAIPVRVFSRVSRAIHRVSSSLLWRIIAPSEPDLAGIFQRRPHRGRVGSPSVRFVTFQCCHRAAHPTQHRLRRRPALRVKPATCAWESTAA